MNIVQYDFGYTWPWNYGHLLAALVFVAAAAVAWKLGRRWLAAAAGLLALWALAGFAVVQLAVRMNLPLELPTSRFLAGGAGTVLDAGAGSGRSALMVLLARPNAELIALDLFRPGYGIGDNSAERLLRNAETAGVASRLKAVSGDMREMPFPEGTFDAAVSAYAIDHLSQDGVRRSLGEIARVLRPGGEFLLMVIEADAYVRLAYPFFVHHGYFGTSPAAERWVAALEGAGFTVVEHGTKPATRYFLGRKDR